MPRDDPADTGGLFVGRRPGSAPLKYRATPVRSGGARQGLDALLAALVLVVEVLLCLSAWGPQVVAWLWVGSRINYWTDSVFAGIVAAFFGLLVSVMATLWLTTQLDGLWRVLRRAAGHDQKAGVLGRIWMWTAILAGGAFLFWFVIIQGPGSTLTPGS